jgi:hypothetical protein
MVIWAKEPEFQIVIFARLKELEDCSVEIYGPIENSNLLSYMQGEVLNSDFTKLVGKEKIEDFLAYQLRFIRGYYDPLREVRKPSIVSRSRIGFDEPYVVGWLVIGNLLNFNVKEIVSDCIKEIVSAAKPPPSPQLEDKVVLEGFGAYIYPPVWIGEVPQPKSFEEKITGRPLWTYASERVMTTMYRQYPLIVTRDGYLAIGIKEKPKALEFLNEIMSTLLLLGIPTYVIREVDLGEATFGESGSSATWSPISPRSWLFGQRFSTYPTLPTKEIVVGKEKINKAIKWSEIITANERIKTLISLFHEAYTYFMATEYKQALVMSWVILEDFYIRDVWASEISKRISDKNRVAKLGRWHPYLKLETLNISLKIPDEEYALLMEIKKARNDIVHAGKTPEKEIVEKCLKLVSDIVRQYVGEYLAAKLPEL